MKIMNSGRILLGALIGFACGATIGILFAPDKGSDIRGKIVERGEDYLDSVKLRLNSLLDSISGMYNGGKVEVSHIGHNGGSKVKVSKTRS